MNRTSRSSDVDSRLLDTRRAFDSVAADYDGPLGNNPLIQRMREQLWRAVEKKVTSGSRLLDIGCGTGIDAVHFASLGFQVVATDWSPQMIERTRSRVQQAGLTDQVSAQPLGVQELDQLDDQFDAAYADLGPLNCAIDLDSAAKSISRLLEPKGKLIVSVIGRTCPWEFIYYALHGDVKRARIRSQHAIVPVNLNQQKVWTRYYSPREFYRACQDQFELNHYRGLSIFLPPPYLMRDRLRSIYRLLGWIDARVGGWPLIRNIGDHFLMVMTKCG
jgi:ubiquinone/menaquinone biosynthesis C-methylase UbiE